MVRSLHALTTEKSNRWRDEAHKEASGGTMGAARYGQRTRTGNKGTAGDV